MNEGFVFKYGGLQKRSAVSENEASGASPVSKEPTKVCAGCGRELPLSAFGGHPRSKDGKLSVCQECRHRRSAKEVAKTAKSNPLAQFTARQLMHELHLRGYDGEIQYVEVHKIRLCDM